MGADIRGWVEIRPPATGWKAAIWIDNIVYRQYGMFASLFGVRNGHNGAACANGRFRAIAFGRGEPPDASDGYTQEHYTGAVGATWMLWSELAAIDWEEEADPSFDLGPFDLALALVEPERLARRRERRGDHLQGGWATLFKLMALLAEQFGADNVRLSVWFDQW